MRMQLHIYIVALFNSHPTVGRLSAEAWKLEITVVSRNLYQAKFLCIDIKERKTLRRLWPSRVSERWRWWGGVANTADAVTQTRCRMWFKPFNPSTPENFCHAHLCHGTYVFPWSHDFSTNCMQAEISLVDYSDWCDRDHDNSLNRGVAIKRFFFRWQNGMIITTKFLSSGMSCHVN